MELDVPCFPSFDSREDIDSSGIFFEGGGKGIHLSQPTDVAQMALFGVSNLWFHVKQAAELTLAQALALRIVAADHKRNVRKLLELVLPIATT